MPGHHPTSSPALENLARHQKAFEKMVPDIAEGALPAGGSSILRVAVSGDPYEIPGRSDFLLRLGVYAGGKLRWLGKDEVIDAGDPPSEKNWRILEAPLPEELAGKTAGLLVQIAYGGPKGIGNEEAFIDRIEVAAPADR